MAGSGRVGAGLPAVDVEKPTNDTDAGSSLSSSRGELIAGWLGRGALVKDSMVASAWSLQMTEALCLQASLRMLFRHHLCWRYWDLVLEMYLFVSKVEMFYQHWQQTMFNESPEHRAYWAQNSCPPGAKCVKHLAQGTFSLFMAEGHLVSMSFGYSRTRGDLTEDEPQFNRLERAEVET